LTLTQMKLALKLVVTLILLGVIVWHLGGLEDVLGSVNRIDPRYIVLILLVNTADRAVMTFKWAWLLHGKGVHLPFFRGMRIYCASMVWGMFLPATMGADVIRAFSTSRLGLSGKEVVASIVIERMVGFLSALVFGLLSLIILSLLGSLDSRFDFVWWLGSATLIGATIVFAASFTQRAFDLVHGRILRRFWNNPVMARLRHLHETYRTYQDNKANLAIFFALTFGEQLMLIFLAWLIARGLGVEVGILYIAGAVPLAFLIARIPISIDGLGVFDGIFMLLMSFAGVRATEAIAICVVGRILQTASWLPWWLADVAANGSLIPPRALAEKR
jgi:uncharacterized protein (TIRG00374 family)